jgi:hypothetical protein
MIDQGPAGRVDRARRPGRSRRRCGSHSAGSGRDDEDVSRFRGSRTRSIGMLQDSVVSRFEASRRFRIPLFKDSKHCCRPIASAAGGTVSAAAAAPTAPAPDGTMIDRGPAGVSAVTL